VIAEIRSAEKPHFVDLMPGKTWQHVVVDERLPIVGGVRLMPAEPDRWFFRYSSAV
jgi:hypothetical protein